MANAGQINLETAVGEERAIDTGFVIDRPERHRGADRSSSMRGVSGTCHSAGRRSIGLRQSRRPGNALGRRAIITGLRQPFG